MNNREAIDKFYDRISWVDQCKEAYFESKLICFCPHSVYLPIDWESFDLGIKSVVRASVFYGLEPSLLITGDAPQEVVEKTWWASHQYNPLIHSQWINHKQQIWFTRFTTRALDGFNWNQSFKQEIN